jgi:hypothetical protein
MTTLDEPYFMTNSVWYVYSFEKEIYILTDQAPQEAIDSYNNFYKSLYNSYQST